MTKFWVITATVIFAVIFICFLWGWKNNRYNNMKLLQVLQDISALNTNEKLIPKNIIQTVPDKDNICAEFQKNIDYIKHINPNWKYMLFDNKSQTTYIQKYYPKLLQYYLAINPKYGASKADFFRYLIMYERGGAYFDVKSAMKFPLDDLIYPSDEYILSHWGGRPHEDKLKKYGEFQQWHIICIPNHPALKAVISNVIKNITKYNQKTHGVGKDAVLSLTGPIVYTRSILPYLYKHNFRISKSNHEIGLIYNNLKVNHENIFGKAHYSRCKESVVHPGVKLDNLYEDDLEDMDVSAELSVAPYCSSVLEIGDGKVSAHINKKLKDKKRHIVVDMDVKDRGEYTVIRKSISDITSEDLSIILPVSCIIIHCSGCLKKFINTTDGMSIVKMSKNIIDKTANKYVTKKILNNLDFVVSETRNSHGSKIKMDIYHKVLRNINPSWKLLLIRSGGTPNKLIDINIQHENLLLLNKFFVRHNIKYFYDCGTLLGIIREGDLLKHDLDSDISVDKKDIHLIRDNIEELQDMGFQDWRNEDSGFMALSLTRKGEYTDIYRCFDINFALRQYQWFNTFISIPAHPEEWLEELYGTNWRTPVKNGDYDDSPWEKGMPKYIKKYTIS
jgi:hypothetical protein